MIFSKNFSAVALLGAVFSSSTAATSVPSRQESNQIICYGCPETIVDKKFGLFDLVYDDPSEVAPKYLECFYLNDENIDLQSFCSYKIEDGRVYDDGDGFCPPKAIALHNPGCRF